jgi:hypothetical protein
MEPAYSTVGGTLPLDSVPTRVVAGRGTFGIARFEVDVTGSGTFGLDFVDATGCLVWIDGKPVPAAPKLQVASGGGRHEVTIVVDTSKRKTGLRATVFDVDGSSAQAQVIGGK